MRRHLRNLAGTCLFNFFFFGILRCRPYLSFSVLILQSIVYI